NMCMGKNIWTDERELLYKISVGDEYAFRILYNRYRKKIYSYALKIIKSEMLAEDILHEVFLRVWQHGNIAEIENIEGYLKIVTRNYTLKILRRQQLEARNNSARKLVWTE